MLGELKLFQVESLMEASFLLITDKGGIGGGMLCHDEETLYNEHLWGITCLR